MLSLPRIHQIGNIFFCPAITPLDEAIEVLNGFLLEPGYDMRVGIQGEGDARMAQPLAHHLGIDAGNEQYGGMGVPEVVETYVGQSRFPECP